MSDDFNRTQDADNAYTAPAEGETQFQFTSRLQPVSGPPVKQKKQHSGLGGVITAVVILLLAAGAVTFVLLRYSLTILHGENGFSVQIARRTISEPILSLAGVDSVPDGTENRTESDTHHYEWDGATLDLIPSRQGEAMNFRQLYQSCAPSVAILEAVFPDGSRRTGTAIVITDDGALIACTHILSGAEKLEVTVAGATYSAYIIGLDYATDLAVVKVDAQGLTSAQFCFSEDAAAGDPVAVIGNPAGGVVNISDAILSAVNPGFSYRGFQVDVLQFASQMGDIASGSALVNSAGQIIGIVNPDMASSDAGGISFAISMRSANSVINELLQNGFVAGRPSSGLTVSEMPPAYAAYYGFPSSLYISAVEELSTAYEAGLRRGDVILEANGEKVETVGDLYTIINGMSAGELLSLTVFRDGETGTVSFALMEAVNPRS